MSEKYGSRKNSAPSALVCVRQEFTGKVKRIKREEAVILTEDGWKYTSKSVWKAYKKLT